MGVKSPFGVATATDMSTTLYCLMKSPIHELLHSGTFNRANDAAFMMKSFTEIFVSENVFSSRRSSITSFIRIVLVK